MDESINLDGLDDQDLVEFADNARGDSRVALAEQLFPLREASSRESAVERMGWYARHLYRARELRVSGKIGKAQGHEGWCDQVYSRLPLYARW